VVSTIAKLMRIASFLICAIVIVSFAIFVIDQSRSASAHQTREVTDGPSAPETRSSTEHEGSVHKAIDEASEKLTSPFAGVVSGTHSEWASRGGKLVLALVIYGFGLGFLARVIRVRV
jgi:hypothetical protein